MSRPPKLFVPFYEGGKRYIWSIASGIVTLPTGETVIPTKCANLDAARLAVQKKVGLQEARPIDTFKTTVVRTLAPGEAACEMGTCPLNFDRENSACAGCRHNKLRKV